MISTIILPYLKNLIIQNYYLYFQLMDKHYHHRVIDYDYVNTNSIYMIIPFLVLKCFDCKKIL